MTPSDVPENLFSFYALQINAGKAFANLLRMETGMNCHGLTSVSGVIGTSGGTSGPWRWLIIAGMDCWQVSQVRIGALLSY